MSAIPHPAHPDAPKYWRFETGGALGFAVMTYLNGKHLDHFQIGLIRAYLSQWVQSPVWDMNPESDVELKQALADLRASVTCICIASMCCSRRVTRVRSTTWGAAHCFS
jgi:hypothetical protein